MLSKQLDVESRGPPSIVVILSRDQFYKWRFVSHFVHTKLNLMLTDVLLRLQIYNIKPYRFQ